ncbi:ESX secretion-associated protein EspG [Saccharopolyspora subtropica]|uniref:ESX secretion-associated protein EspG n=1 Tax=Saccharopolyspora thermophila TaxID=89367 RepID=A0A917K4C1_9PSEU|nr:ESX secretion-associated protein EspG [Saccharopolyspora subtropica]GGI97481.1 ESX secretion-associated protein EspG [Saccharopolyspora subtropica]
MALVGRWQLHPLHLYLARSYLDLDDLTLPLEGPSYGRTTQQLGEVARREASTMEALGILVRNEIEPRLARALKVLAKPYLWVDSLWFPDFASDHAWRAVVAMTEGQRVVLGVQGPGETERFGGVLTVEVHERTTLSEVLIPTLPPARPGNRAPVRVPESSLRQNPREELDSLLEQVSHSRGSSGDQQVAAYHEIGQAVHVRGGQLAANLRDRYGRVRRSQVVRWFDNAEPDGRYLDHSERGSTGEQMYVITPADGGVIRATIDQLVAAVRG